MKYKRSLNLNLIKLKLIGKKYASIQQWFDDMELVFSYDELDSFMQLICDECKKLYNKYKSDFYFFTSDEWHEAINHLKSKLLNTLRQHPSSIESSQITKENMKKFVEAEFQKLIAAKNKTYKGEYDDEITQLVSDILNEIEKFSTDNQSSFKLEKIEDLKNDECCKLPKVLVKETCVKKEMNQNQNQQILINEFKIMKSLYHPNVLKARDIIINHSNISILIEYFPSDLILTVEKKKFNNIQKVFSIYQIANGMKYIHSNDICHQNLTPASIFIDENETLIKIGNFENATKITSNSSEDEKDALKKNDVFAFGNIVYFILSGKEVGKNRNMAMLDSFPPLAQQLIYACWLNDIKLRPSFDIICNILEKNNFNLVSLSKEDKPKN